jgi:DHA1 family tetracycline resistance protein-like MFS transporter
LAASLLGSLSDTYGRKPFLFLTRAGLAFWFLGAHWGNSVRTMMLAEIVSWSAFGASLTLQNAAFNDMFGDRPELSAELSSRIGGTTGIGGFLGPILGIFLNQRFAAGGPRARFYHIAAFWLPGMIMVAQAILFVVARPESLPAERRKPFRYATANPLASGAVLFTNGPGMAKLAISACLYSEWPVTIAPRNNPTGCIRACESLLVSSAISSNARRVVRQMRAIRSGAR